MKLFIGLLVVICTLVSPAYGSESKVLVLISSFGTEEQPDLTYDLEELAQSFLVMHDNGIVLDIASPKGGKVLVKNNKDELEYIQRFKSLALNKLNNTLASAEVDAKDYEGVFIIGGGGAMMDLPFHAATQKLLTEFVSLNKTITAVCHGPAAIANIKLADGKYFVAGKRVNSFTNIEEKAFSKENSELFSFLIEDKLKQNGAHFDSNKPMLPYVAKDQNLITAQNPSSVAQAAEATVLKLGLPLKPRELFKDEATMRLISQARMDGGNSIDIALTTSPQKFDMNYLALYGFYAYPLAAEKDKQIELGIMKTISKHFHHVQFDSALINRLVTENQPVSAQQQLELFVKRYPKNELVSTLTEKVRQLQAN
jgi:putative intracellular protease/amidase